MNLRSATAAGVLALLCAGTVGMSPASATNYTTTHLKCDFGGGKVARMDVTTNPYDAKITHVQYATTPAFHAERVTLMIQKWGATKFSTIVGVDGVEAEWGDGSTGSAPTSFGSAKGAGVVLQYGYDTLKVKVDETGRIPPCQAVAGN